MAYRRRDMLAMPVAAGAALTAAAAQAAAQSGRRKVIDEYDPGNIKLSHRLTVRNMSDDDFLFLQQIGMKWARVEFGSQAPFDYMKAT